MPKQTPDYDSVFKTMKSKNKRMFIPVINDIFEKEYPLDADVEVLPSEGNGNIEAAVKDLEYFRDELLRLYEAKELSYGEMRDLTGFVNTIITHITDGNKNEERLVAIMGGTILETESEKLIRMGREEGKIQMIIEMGQEDGLDDTSILKKIQEKIGLTLEQATAYLEQYGKQLI